MKTFKKILVPTDFSKGAGEAYPYAQKVAEKFGAKIDFIHVVPTTRYFSESIKKLGVPFDMDKDLFPHIIDESEHQLEELMNSYLREENKGKAIVQVERKASEAIAEYAREHDYDLVLMGARGKHDTEFLKGSITEKVIRYSEVPVLSVASDMPSGGLKHIMVPTDTSEIAFKCIPWALSLAEAFEADLTLFHVIELYGSLSENIPHEPGQAEILAIYEAILNELQKIVDDLEGVEVEIKRGDESFEDQLVLKRGASSTSIPLHTTIKKGVSAHYEIEDYASSNADLVVMTTHGHTGLAHIFLGSTTEKVAQYLSLPVLTVRPHDEHLNHKE